MKTLTKQFAFYTLLIAVCYLQSVICDPAYAGPPAHATSSKPTPSLLSGCTPGAAMTDLDVNNVRARMCTGGDYWWDYAKQIGQYEVPKGSGKMPIYAGALWIGGFNSGNLYLAAQEYRQGGNDWWPGPLDTILAAATISPDVCQQYDQHYKITQTEVSAFVGGSGPATAAINNWPGNGNTSIGQAQFLAPFFDKNGDGKYKPSDGDYPGFDLFSTDNFGGCQINNCVPVDQLFGDECLWWVMNDKGNIHTQTKGLPMGLEVHCQAFGFFTDDEINSMTFINYRIYNRSSVPLDSSFIGIWCDPDLGGGGDDYVGCDVTRGLGYVYNGENIDPDYQGELGYGANPPACGIDFFRGPIATPGDGVDNNHNCVTDEICEQAIMTHFTYFTNGAAPGYGDPSIAKEYYNYLSGSWANGNPVLYGGLGYPPTSTAIPAAYCFPGLSDQQVGWGTGGTCVSHNIQPNWTEVTAAATFGDRRLVESAGPFRLLPGAVNVVTAGVVYAKASSGGPQASVNLMLLADDKAQKLFDNCFQVLNGPDAPDLTIQELDKKLILYITNKPTSNNYNENYNEYDPSISLADSTGSAMHCIDTAYHFEGYKIFQLKDGTVSSGDLDNADKARLVAQCDVKNGITTIVNFIFDQTLNASIPTTEVTGTDKGIFHSLVVTTDLFAKGDPTLVNHKTYRYMALAYGYNNFKPYKQDGLVNLSDNKCPLPATVLPAMDGQKKPYKQGRKNLLSYSAIPHISTPYTGGTEMHGEYGSGPMITRVEGNGNGGMILDFVPATTAAILASPTNKAASLTYDYGKGPVNIKVVDPLNVPDGQTFTLKFDSVNIANSTWNLVNNATPTTVIHSDKTIKLINEQLVLQYGFAISIVQPTDPGSQKSPNGFLEATTTKNSWLSAVADAEGTNYANWIRSGISTATPYQDYTILDPDQIYEGILGGTWAPYALTGCSTNPFSITGYYTGPGFNLNYMPLSKMQDLASVDVVFTSDKSKWTRCDVIEMCESILYSQNGARKHDKRAAPSVDKSGKKSGDAGYNSSEGDYINTTGMGWFPGYAINIETGERLNMAFGENSALSGGKYEQHGADMMWNPTSKTTDTIRYAGVTSTDTVGPVFGGQHYIYVFGHNSKHLSPSDNDNVPCYDGGKFMDSILSLNGGQPGTPDKRGIYRDAMWVNLPLLAAGHSLLESDVTIRLRVGKTYKKGYATVTDTAATSQNKNLPMYTFGTDGIATHTGQNDLAVSALDLINVVPNPYYAYSSYETNNLDNRIKITNLPEQCTVSIYNLGGTLVRRIKKGEAIVSLTPKGSDSPVAWHDGSLDWDLKNTAGTPIASGIYIIHVEVPGVGEKVVKWFGVMRPIDLGSF